MDRREIITIRRSVRVFAERAVPEETVREHFPPPAVPRKEPVYSTGRRLNATFEY